MTLYVGVIAEDISDVDVFKKILGHYKLPSFTTRHFVGKGCSKIKGKARAWAINLRLQGCTRLVVIHDADDNDQVKLLADIKAALHPIPIPLHVISIPVRELEAWLLADHEAIRKGLKIKAAVKKVANPEALPDAKKHLGSLIRQVSQKRISYLNTVHNKLIAAECSLDALRRCESFHSLDKFILSHVAK